MRTSVALDSGSGITIRAGMAHRIGTAETRVLDVDDRDEQARVIMGRPVHGAIVVLTVLI